jgi:hypothetical protein
MLGRARRPAGPLPLLALLAGGALTAACASRRAPPGNPPVAPQQRNAIPAACLVITDSIGPPRPITAVFADSGDARRARLASTLEPPLRLDCEGRPEPGLATAWSRDTSGRFWTLELGGVRGVPRDGSGDEAGHPNEGTSGRPSGATRFAWTASALAAAWRASPDASAALRDAGVESLLPLDDRRLTVGFSRPELEPPGALADRTLGVAVGESDSMAIVALAPTGDLRDAVDRGADLVQTDDPALLDYASRRPGLVAVPLPWSRTYILLLPAGTPGIGGAIPPDTAGFRQSLAREVVRADARPAAELHWRDDGGCRPTPALPATRRSSVVAYPAADRVARDLAERIVALAGDAGLSARGLTDSALSEALRGGSERAFVVAVPLHAPVPCRERARWPAGSLALPLVDTRSHALVRRGAPPMVVEWDGALRPAPDSAGAAR